MTRRTFRWECMRCGQFRTAVWSWPGGRLCGSCYRRALTSIGDCRRCGQRRVLPSRADDGTDICATCAHLDGFTCTRCGAGDKPMIHPACCARCDCRQRLIDTLHPDSEPAGTAAALIDVLADGNPRVVLTWLSSQPDRVALLRAIARGDKPLSHATIDELAATRNVDHLRHQLIDGGLLPDIHHDLARFDTWAERFLATIDNDADRMIIATYIAWHHRRRLVRMIELNTLRPFSIRGARQLTRVAAQLLAWLKQRGVTLADCRQADIDEWFATGPTTRTHSITFLVWARATRRCRRQLRFPNHKPAMPIGMPRDDRVALIAQLLTGDHLDLADRVAGLLVALYAQPVSRLCHVHLDDINLANLPATVVVHSASIELDADTGHLLHQLVDQRTIRGHEWLFPGRHAHRHVAAKSLTERLNRIGITCNARVAAFHDLAIQIPSPVLAELIGYNANFLAERATTLGTPWLSYSALRRSR